MSTVRITRKRLAVSNARNQMPCFSFVVEMDAARPRATLRGGAESSAVGADEVAFSVSWEVGRLTELTVCGSTVAWVDASQRVVIGVSLCRRFVPCDKCFGSLVDFFGFIGFAAEVFKDAKFDVSQGSNLAS